MSEKKEIRLSWSRLKTYETCKQRVLRQMEGKAVKVDGRIFLPGTVTDRVMREWLESSDPQPGQMQERISAILDAYSSNDEESEYFIKWRTSKAEDKQAVYEQVLEAVTALEPLLMEKVVPFDYQPELRFQTRIAVPDLDGVPTPITLIGGMDLLIRDDKDDFEISDLKTTSAMSYVKSSIGQLDFYSIAFTALFGIQGQPVRASFLTPLLPQKYIPVELTTQRRREMLARIVRYCHGVWREEWTPTDDNAPCWNCEVKNSCDKYRLPILVDSQHNRRVSFNDLAKRRRAQKEELREQRTRDAETSTSEGLPSSTE